METRINYTLTGLFVLLLGGLLIAGILWLSVRTPAKNFNFYYVYIDESVSGLNRDAPVKYRGVEVGRVTEIRIDPQNSLRVRLLLAIEKETPIKEDTVASLVFQGLTGVAHINLRSRRRQAPPLKIGVDEKYPVIHSEPSLFTRLDEDVTGMIASMTKAANRLQAFLDGDKGRLVDQILIHLEKVAATLEARAGSLDAALLDAALTFKNSAKASAALPGLISQLESVGSELKIMARAVSLQSQEVARAASGGAAGIVQLSTDAGSELRTLSVALQTLLQRLEKLAAELERDPALMIYGRSPVPAGPGE